MLIIFPVFVIRQRKCTVLLMSGVWRLSFPTTAQRLAVLQKTEPWGRRKWVFWNIPAHHVLLIWYMWYGTDGRISAIDSTGVVVGCKKCFLACWNSCADLTILTVKFGPVVTLFQAEFITSYNFQFQDRLFRIKRRRGSSDSEASVPRRKVSHDFPQWHDRDFAHHWHR